MVALDCVGCEINVDDYIQYWSKSKFSDSKLGRVWQITFKKKYGKGGEKIRPTIHIRKANVTIGKNVYAGDRLALCNLENILVLPQTAISPEERINA